MESSQGDNSLSSSSLGSSLLVPCVQELAKDPLLAVPQRYIRPDLDLNVHDAAADEVPVIDFQRLLDPDSTDSELSKLHSASKDWGFFQLVNHGVSSSLLEKMKSQVEDLFNLPTEEKKKFGQLPGEIEDSDKLSLYPRSKSLTGATSFSWLLNLFILRKPHLFPNLPLPLRETMERYSSEVKSLAVAILDQMAKVLKMKAEEMKELTDEIWQSIRINYYPPCPEPEKVIGFNPHSDGSALTILLQANDIQGLQIMKDGKWLPIVPLPNAFVVNIGDMLEMKTNGAYKSIMHRATVNSGKERLSIATFHAPRFDVDVGPAASLIAEQSPALYKRTTVEEYYNGFFSRQLHAKSYLETLRIQHGESCKRL